MPPIPFVFFKLVDIFSNLIRLKFNLFFLCVCEITSLVMFCNPYTEIKEDINVLLELCQKDLGTNLDRLLLAQNG